MKFKKIFTRLTISTLGIFSLTTATNDVSADKFDDLATEYQSNYQALEDKFKLIDTLIDKINQTNFFKKRLASLESELANLQAQGHDLTTVEKILKQVEQAHQDSSDQISQEEAEKKQEQIFIELQEALANLKSYLQSISAYYEALNRRAQDVYQQFLTKVQQKQQALDYLTTFEQKAITPAEQKKSERRTATLTKKLQTLNGQLQEQERRQQKLEQEGKELAESIEQAQKQLKSSQEELTKEHEKTLPLQEQLTSLNEQLKANRRQEKEQKEAVESLKRELQNLESEQQEKEAISKQQEQTLRDLQQERQQKEAELAEWQEKLAHPIPTPRQNDLNSRLQDGRIRNLKAQIRHQQEILAQQHEEATRSQEDAEHLAILQEIESNSREELASVQATVALQEQRVVALSKQLEQINREQEQLRFVTATNQRNLAKKQQMIADYRRRLIEFEKKTSEIDLNGPSAKHLRERNMSHGVIINWLADCVVEGKPLVLKAYYLTPENVEPYFQTVLKILNELPPTRGKTSRLHFEIGFSTNPARNETKFKEKMRDWCQEHHVSFQEGLDLLGEVIIDLDANLYHVKKSTRQPQQPQVERFTATKPFTFDFGKSRDSDSSSQGSSKGESSLEESSNSETSSELEEQPVKVQKSNY